MTTIAQMEVMLVTNLNKYKSGLDTAKTELNSFEGHTKSTISRMESHWVRSITRIAAAYVGIRAVWNLVQESIQDGIDQMYYAIKSELAPELEGLNKQLSELAHSDFPARLAAGLKTAWYWLQGFYYDWKSLYALFVQGKEEAARVSAESTEAYRKSRENWGIMWEGTKDLKTDWSKYKPQAQPEAATKPIKTPSLMERFEAATYYDPETGHRLQRSPEQQAAYEASKQPQTVNNTVIINIDSLTSMEAPLVITRKLGEAGLMGLDSNDVGTNVS